MANLKISLAKLTLQDVRETDILIGTGAYGSVKECFHLGQKFAEKIVHPILTGADSEQSTSLALKFEEECKRLSTLNHPNIVCFIGVYFKKNKELPSLIMELLPMSLSSTLEKYPSIPSSMKFVVLLDVACGLSYLHTRKEPVVHRDLSSNNVILTDNFRAKIVDFGVARVVPLEQLELKLTQMPGTAVFMPPEAYPDNPIYDISLDMFSYGVLILNVINQTWPKAKDRVEGGSILTEIQRRAEDLGKMTCEELKPFTVRCLQQEPPQRPTALQAIEELTKLVEKYPRPYSNSFMMLKEIDNLRLSCQVLQRANEEVSDEVKVKCEENNQLHEQVAAMKEQIDLTSANFHQVNSKQQKEIAQYQELIATHDEQVTVKDGLIAAKERELAALRNMPHQKLQLLDPTVKLKWSQGASLPHPRKHVQAVQLDDKLYIGSGYGDDEEVSSTVYCLDLNTESWKDCPNSLTVQYAMAKFDGKVILIGGNLKTNSALRQEVQYATEGLTNGEVEVSSGALADTSPIQETGKIQYLSEDGSQWKFFTEEEMPSMPTARLGAVAVALGCDLVVAGGYGRNRSRLKVVEIFNMPSKSWYPGIDLPYSAAEFKAALSHGNQWYLLGGASNTRNAAICISLKKMIKKCIVPMAGQDNDGENHEQIGWINLPTLPHDFSSVAVFGDCLVVLGGEGGFFRSSCYDNIHVYEPHRQQWVRIASMPCALSKCTAISLSSGNLLVMGGYSNHRKLDNVLLKCSLMSSEDLEDSQNEE